MIKMYNVEVLSKFPVVQHFPFGSLFAWESDPNAKAIQASVHTSSQPKQSTSASTAPTARPQPGMRDPLANQATAATRAPGGMPMTAAPWANGQTTRAPWASSGTTVLPAPNGSTQSSRAPARGDQGPPSSNAQSGQPATRAPWA